MHILAHRGMAIEYPENSMPALKAACEQGFGLELDIHRTKDGAIAVIHDADLSRVTSGVGKVTAKNLDELKKLDNGAWFNTKFSGVRISTLNEMCDMFLKVAKKETTMAINIKDEREKDIEKLVVDCIISCRMKERCFVFDMGLESIKKFKAIDKRIEVAARVSEKEPWDRVRGLSYVDIIWYDEFFGDFYTKETIKEIHGDNKKVYAISPELHKNERHPRAQSGYEETWDLLISWGIDGICTDYPLELRERLKCTP